MIQREEAEILYVCCFCTTNYIFLICLYCTYYVVASFFWHTDATPFIFSQLGMVKQACYPSTDEAKSGGSQACSHPELSSKVLSKISNK